MMRGMSEHSALPLPEDERARRQRDWWLALGVVLVGVVVLYVRGRLARLPDVLPFADSVLFLVLTSVSAGLIALLAYLIFRQFIKLVFERRAGALGASLKLKLVIALFVVVTVPTSVVLLVSSSFIKGSFDSWFTLQMDRAVTQSREVADASYASWSSSALHLGGQIAQQITERQLLQGREALTTFVQRKQREYNLGVVQVFPLGEEEALATLINPEIPSAVFAKHDSALVASAFEGERATLVESTGSEIGDVIRGAVPIFSHEPGRADEVAGVLVVNHLVPHPLLDRVSRIREAGHEYSFFKSYADEIVGTYRMMLLLVAGAFVFLAIWWAMRMARGVTDSIAELVSGTERVARGDLDVALPQRSNDEVGQLVLSFNQMTHDLKQALTGLEHSNAELEQRRRYMEVVLRNVDTGVVSLDAAGCIGTINPAALRLFGLRRGTHAIGRKFEEVLQNPALLEVLGELTAQTRAGVRESVRRPVQLTLGEQTRTLVVTLSLLQDEEGRALGSVVVFDDYTQEMRAQRMAAWREVAQRIAHEIKNPLTPIQLSAHRMRRRFRERFAGADAQVFDEAVDTITSHVDGLKILVNEFSQFARLPEAKLAPADLNALVREAVSSYKGAEGVRVFAELDAALPLVDLDRGQVRRVLTNFLDNACSACAEARGTGDGGTGEVAVRSVYDAQQQTVRLEVADNGGGIREEHRRHVFEPYYSTKVHGTGLGLAIVARIVAEHHGTVRVHTNTPHGARFIVELPIKAG